MFKLRRMTVVSVAAIAIGGMAAPAFSMETGTFQNRLNGATVGLPLGATPPPGLYTGVETVYLGELNGPNNNSAHSTGNQCAPTGNGGCATILAVSQAVPLLWVPGWTLFGASYSASVVQAFYEFALCGAAATGGNCTGAAPISGGGFVYTNTFVQPISLSWNLGEGWFFGAGFAFTAPDGTRAVGTPNPDYWTFEPSVAVSYLSKSWTASANFFYDINTKSQNVCCAATGSITSGNALYGDLSAVYKIGKWSIGPVGYFAEQTTSDTGPGCAAGLCGRYHSAAAGALVGYDFGPVDMQVWITDQFAASNYAGGTGYIIAWSRIGFKIWGPDAPKALVSKN
jgi:hypothetical protein